MRRSCHPSAVVERLSDREPAPGSPLVQTSQTTWQARVVSLTLGRPVFGRGVLLDDLVLAVLSSLRSDGEAVGAQVDDLVVRLYRAEGRSLVRLARLFVDDRNAAEDLVQEAFIRLARHTGDIEAVERAPAYLRSIVLNLARDHNRRGLVSLRHQSASVPLVDDDDPADGVTDRLARDADNLAVLECVRRLPIRQRDCITLRYFEELSLDQIAAALGVSVNSVKTHLRRAIEHLGRAMPARSDDA
jgi:RNA polymerase sigma factor (sigma-70 family)